MEAIGPSHAGGISFVTFIVAVALSLAYYQFAYLPQANARPVLPEAVLDPEETVHVRIVEGSSNKANPQNFVPEQVRAVMGVSNRVAWTNNDSIMHSVTGEGYVDRISGRFDSTERLGRLIKSGETFEFIFTKVGEYYYHCEPHPHMQGRIMVIEDFS